MKKVEKTRIISRTMYCPDCNARKRPAKNDWFVVYGQDHKELLIKKNHQDGLSGYTPHLILWDEAADLLNGKIHVIAYCAIHGCGIWVENLDSDDSSEKRLIKFIQPKVNWLTVGELKALILWKGTGYEII